MEYIGTRKINRSNNGRFFRINKNINRKKIYFYQSNKPDDINYITKFKLNNLIKLPFQNIRELTDQYTYIQHQNIQWSRCLYNHLKKITYPISKKQFIIMCKKINSNKYNIVDAIQSGEIIKIL